jgi:PKD repeat protein
MVAFAALFPISNASAQLVGMGPISPDNGFPTTYTDAQGTTLNLCLSNAPMCLLAAAAELLNPGLPFPLNYAGTFDADSFYWAGDADMATNAGGRALLIMGLKAGFVNGAVVPGEQVVFGRIRLRIDNLVAGATYTCTTPFGTFTQVATNSARRGINFTQDIGLVPGQPQLALNSGIGPFLRWDRDLPIVDAQGMSYIGDPAIPHTVTGSPTGNNFFRITGPNVGGPGINSIQTNLFNVMGQLGVLPPTASFNAAPLTGTAPLTVNFTDTSTGTITSRSWNFGDGGTSAAQNPSHVYTTAGTFTVSLTVTGPGGSNTATRVGLITVNAAPGANPVLGAPTPGTAGRVNAFPVSGCTPGSRVTLLIARDPGSSFITIGGVRVRSSLLDPTVLGSGIAGTDGRVTLNISISSFLAGRTRRLQAFDAGSRRFSNVVIERF